MNAYEEGAAAFRADHENGTGTPNPYRSKPLSLECQDWIDGYYEASLDMPQKPFQSDVSDILAMRLRFQLTQSQMAALMGMPQSSYARIESGRRKPTRKDSATLKALALLHELGALVRLLKNESK
jgi:DNA-binding transcriptional regulator YiaG